MSDRADFSSKGEEILDFFDAYGVLRHEHLEKFFPDSKKIVGYLIKNKRLYKSPDGIYISSERGSRPDKCLISALGVLADVFDKVKSHTMATAPIQISFITHNGDYFEVIYVGYGMEAMVTAAFETQQNATKQDKDYTDNTKRMVIIEDTGQMDRLQIPKTMRFALVQPNGSLTYYKGS